VKRRGGEVGIFLFFNFRGVKREVEREQWLTVSASGERALFPSLSSWVVLSVVLRFY
jgi:hypothetical protein